MGLKSRKNTLVIDRKKWLRGGDGCLLNFKGEMCCLGFFARKCGFSTKEIEDHIAPSDVFTYKDYSEKIKFPNWLVDDKRDDGVRIVKDTLESQNLMEINDNPGVSDSTREKKIAKIFKKHGINVVFK